MKQPLTVEQSTPLTREQSEIFIGLVFAEKKDPEQLVEMLNDDKMKNSFPFQVYQKRIEVMHLPLKLTPGALIFLLSLCDRVGHIPCFMVDCLELQRDLAKDTLTLDDIVMRLYPYGFYTEQAFENRVDNELKPRKGEFDYVY